MGLYLVVVGGGGFILSGVGRWCVYYEWWWMVMGLFWVVVGGGGFILGSVGW